MLRLLVYRANKKPTRRIDAHVRASLPGSASDAFVRSRTLISTSGVRLHRFSASRPPEVSVEPEMQFQDLLTHSTAAATLDVLRPDARVPG
jgi:hypothetical protein